VEVGLALVLRRSVLKTESQSKQIANRRYLTGRREVEEGRAGARIMTREGPKVNQEHGRGVKVVVDSKAIFAL
jgi:hypothetical protein